jgi:lipid-A-disaccharide synthase
VPHVFLSAGDISGDQHAARLVSRLNELVPDLTWEGLGGPELQAVGVPLHADLVSKAIMGIGPAAKAAPRLMGLLRRMAGVLDARRPDVVVLVDYPGLNLFMARLAKRRGIPVVYFVAPQLWAWAPWRVRRFARVVDEALVIFPFEVPFYRQAGVAAEYIGHPLLDSLPAEPPRIAEIVDRPRPVALLPGSRSREVKMHMPLLLDAAEALTRLHPDSSFHCAHVSAERRAEIEALAADRDIDFTMHGASVHEVMAGCRCAAVSSGTATLETAMLGTPLVVLYRVTTFEYSMRNILLVPPFVGQVNLVAGEAVTKELLLPDDDPKPLIDALEPLLSDTPEFLEQRAALDALIARSPGPGAVDRAAEHLALRLQGTVPASR